MLACRARRYVWNSCRLRRLSRAVAVKEDGVEIIPFPREGAGLNYALNWALASKGIPPSGQVFDNLKDEELQEYGARPQDSVSGSRIYARGSFSSGAAGITKAQFNKLFKEVAQHLSSCDMLFMQDGSIGASIKHIKVHAVCDNPSAAATFRSTLFSAIERGESSFSVYIASSGYRPKDVELAENFLAADYDRSALIVGGNASADTAALKNVMTAIAVPAIVANGAMPLKARILAIGDHRVIVVGPDSIVFSSNVVSQAAIFPDEGVIWSENGIIRLFQTQKAGVPKLVSPTALVLVTAERSGALPLVSKLGPEQSGFHYLAGYDGESYTPVYNKGLVSIDPVTLAKKLTSMVASTHLPAFLVNAYAKSGEELLKLIDRASNPKEPKSNEEAAKAWSHKHKDYISKTFPAFSASSSS